MLYLILREGGDIWNGTKGALTFFGRSELTENRGTVTVFDGVLPDGTANNIAVPLTQSWYQGNGGGFGCCMMSTSLKMVHSED